MSKTLKKTWNIVSTVVVVLVVIVAVLLAGVRVFGLQVYTVLSGSMEPTYHTGSLIYVKSVDYTELKVGDPITFMLDEDTVATHRIVEIIPDEEDASVLRFRTKGDANETEDGSLVHYKNIIGKPVFTIPYLGYLANFIQTPPGLFYAIAAGAALILLAFLPDMLAGEKKKPLPEPDPDEKVDPDEKADPDYEADADERADTAEKAAPVSERASRRSKKSPGRHSKKGRHEA